MSDHDDMQKADAELFNENPVTIDDWHETVEPRPVVVIIEAFLYDKDWPGLREKSDDEIAALIKADLALFLDGSSVTVERE